MWQRAHCQKCHKLFCTWFRRNLFFKTSGRQVNMLRCHAVKTRRHHNIIWPLTVRVARRASWNPALARFCVVFPLSFDLSNEPSEFATIGFQELRFLNTSTLLAWRWEGSVYKFLIVLSTYGIRKLDKAFCITQHGQIEDSDNCYDWVYL